MEISFVPALRHNLPHQTTSFIGRSLEVGKIKQRLTGGGEGEPPTRALTLVGVGGCGKTRLALQVATDLAFTNGYQGTPRPFPDGIWRVDLAPLTDPARLPYTLAASLGVPDEPGRPILTTLIHTLRPKNLLIVLDNCEHLKAACADLVERLLAHCPHLSILATSRLPLGLPDERVIALAGLAPDEATQLFVERASRLVWGFDRTPANAPAIDHICHTLAGLPLALELAATRVSALSVQEIAARLNDTVRLLTRNPSPDARHPTLEATLDWSYALLTEAGQRLWRRLAVFAGSFSLEGVAAVGEAGEGDAEPTLNALSELMDHSLVNVVSGDDQPTPTRYRLLEPVRQYAWDKLTSAGEVADTRRRHAYFYDDLTRRCDVGLHGPNSAPWHALVDQEPDNLQAAIQWAAEHNQPEIELQIGIGITAHWHIRGRFSQLYDILDSAVRRADHATPRLRARALTCLSATANYLARYTQAAEIDTHLLRLYQDLEDLEGIAAVLTSMAIRAGWQGDFTQAGALFKEILNLARQSGDKRREAAMLNNLAELALQEGAFKQAQDYLTQSAALFSEINHLRGISLVLGSQGELALTMRDFDTAFKLLSHSLSMNVRHGYRTGQIENHTNLGKLRRLQGEPEAALAHLKEAMRLCLAQKSKPEEILCLVGVAGILVDVGQYERAAHILAAAETLRASIGLGLLPLDAMARDSDMAVIQSRLDPATLTRAQTAGHALDWEQVGAYTLETELVKEATPDSPSVTPIPPPHPGLPESGPLPHAPDKEFCFYAFGSTKVYRHDYLVTDKDWTFVKPKELLFYLLSHPGATKEQISQALWPRGATAHQLQSRFYDALHRLRRVLEDRNRTMIVRSEGSYRLNPTLSYWYDVAVFETLARQTTSAEMPPLSHLEQTAALYQGDFLADFPPSDWIHTRRAELQQRYVHVLLTLGNLYLKQDRVTEASDLFQRVIQIDALIEEAHRQLMRCYVRLGERGRAVHHYQTWGHYLYQELAAQPDSDTSLLSRLTADNGTEF